MIAIDTNVLVRIVTNDDPAQARQAMKCLATPDGVFVGKTVLLELEWVLRSAYRLPRENIHRAMMNILGLPGLVAEDAEQLASALDGYRQGLDFADALHYAASQGGTSGFHTFDVRFAKRGRDLGLDVHEIAVKDH